MEEGGSAWGVGVANVVDEGRGWCLGVVRVVLLFSCGVAALVFALLSLCLFSLSCCAVFGFVKAPQAPQQEWGYMLS